MDSATIRAMLTGQNTIHQWISGFPKFGTNPCRWTARKSLPPEQTARKNHGGCRG